MIHLNEESRRRFGVNLDFLVPQRYLALSVEDFCSDREFVRGSYGILTPSLFGMALVGFASVSFRRADGENPDTLFDLTGSLGVEFHRKLSRGLFKDGELALEDGRLALAEVAYNVRDGLSYLVRVRYRFQSTPDCDPDGVYLRLERALAGA